MNRMMRGRVSATQPLYQSSRQPSHLSTLIGLSASCILGAMVFTAGPRAQAQAQPPVPPAVMALEPDVARTAEALLARGLADNRAYDLVSDLTTRVGPRPGGSPEEAKAHEWAMFELKRLGLRNVRVEPFEVEGWRRGAIAVELLSPRGQSLVATALGYSPAAPAGGVEGEVVFFNTMAELRAAAPGSLKGRIAFVNQVTPRAQDGSGYGWSVGARARGAQEASKRGAVALLLRSIGTSTHRFAHTGGQSYEPGVTRIPAAAISAPDANLLKRLAATTREPLRVRIKLDAESLGPRPSGNVIAEIPGREKPDEIVLLGAHLDSWDPGTGAIDDGAGVAIVTAAAKLIAETLPKGPKRTIRIVLFGSEEVGLVGAEAYATAHEAELPRHVIAAESDFGARKIWRFETRVRPEALPKTRAIGEILSRLAITPGGNDTTGGPDLQPLLRKGVPVVALTQDGSDYFDTHHTPNDVLERIDPADLPQQVAAYAVFAFLAAELGGEAFGPVAPASRPAR